MEVSVQRRIAGFSAQELFPIAANVEAYPKFLPFCVAARVLDEKDHVQKVDNVFGVGPVRSRFLTRANLEEPERIHITSDDPQFDTLSITWTFQSDQTDGCLVSFEMKQVFKSAFKNRIVKSLSRDVEKKLIERFEAQARKVLNRPYSAKSSS